MTDVIVIGGGLLGFSTAYHCVLAGARTTLVDRRDAGWATGAGAGIISSETETRGLPHWFEFAVQAGAYYPPLLESLKADGAVDTGYARCGLVLAATGEDELAAFAAGRDRILARQRSRGTPAPEDLREITPDEARRFFPAFRTVLGAVYHRHAARVDGRLLAQALQNAAQRRGLEVRRGSATALTTDGARVTGVVIDGEACPAARVVIAGGAWSKAFGDQLRVRIPVEPQRGQIIHLKMRGVNVSDWTIVNGFRGHYIVPWPDGRVVVGASRETGSGYDPRLTAGGVREVLTEALRAAPGLVDGEIHEMRVGLRPLAVDGLPVLGAVPAVAGVYLATGHGPSGLQLGPFSGKVVADVALGRDPGVDLDPFRVTRFDGT